MQRISFDKKLQGKHFFITYDDEKSLLNNILVCDPLGREDRNFHLQCFKGKFLLWLEIRLRIEFLYKNVASFVTVLIGDLFSVIIEYIELSLV